MAHPEAVAKAVTMLVANWPNYKINKFTIGVLHGVTGDIDDDTLLAAVVRCIAEETFFPAAATIRAKAFEIIGQENRAPDPYEAWAEVQAAIRDVGSYGTPNWTHPLIPKAIQVIGGWRMLCLSENIASDRARFIDAYKEFEHRAWEDRKALPGVREVAARLASTVRTPRLPAPKEKRDA